MRCDSALLLEMSRILERDDQDLKALQMMAVIAAAKDGAMGLVVLFSF